MGEKLFNVKDYGAKGVSPWILLRCSGWRRCLVPQEHLCSGNGLFEG